MNSRIRYALKQRDSQTVFQATLQLCSQDQRKADQLVQWFSEVAKRCRNNKNITTELTKMRMWQLGNMDIKEVSKNGIPIFTLTISGSEKIHKNPKDKWFEVLLLDPQRQFA